MTPSKNQNPTPSADSKSPEPLASVVFITGKGGVGKTTIAAGLATAAAQSPGGSALIEFGDGDSGARALRHIPKDLEHIVIRPAEALMMAATPVFGSKTVARLAMGNFAMKRFFDAAPAMRELSMLESIRQYAEKRPNQQLFVDLPSTGHGLAWLRIPQQIRDLAGSGPFHKLAARLSSELLAPGKCSIVVVTLPEPMVLNETIELCEAMSRDVGLAVSRLIVNRIPIALPQEAAADAELLAQKGGPIGAAAECLAKTIRARQKSRRTALIALHGALKRTEIVPNLLREAPSDPDITDVANWLKEGGVI